MKNKKFLIFCLIVIIELIIVTLIIVGVNKWSSDDNIDDGIIYNTNEQVVSDQTVNGITFSNIKYIFDGKETIIIMDVTNNNSESVKLNQFVAKVYSQEGELLEEFAPLLENIIESGDTYFDKRFSIAENYSDAYSMKFELPNMEFVE